MRKLHYLLFALTMGLAVSMTSCSSDNNDSPVGPVDPVNPTPETPTANKTIKEIKALAVDGEFKQITEDFIIEGVVISSDEAGNFYKALWLQDTKDGGEGGIYLKVNKDDLYQEFAIGQKIVVKCKDLELEVYGGQPSLGTSYMKDGEQKLGGVDAAKIAATIFKDGEATTPTANIVAIDALTDALVGTLIKIENLQVKDGDLTKTYAVDKKSTNIILTNAAGEEIIVRTSGYAAFKGETVAQGSGSVTAILSKFNETYQLSLRNVADIDMAGTRFTVAGGDNGGDDGDFVADDKGDNLLANADLEAWDDDNNPSGFTHVENITKEATTFHGGSFSAKFMSSSKTKDFGTEVDVIAGKKYRVSYWYLDNDVNARLRVWSKFRGGPDNAYTDLTSDEDKPVLQSNEYSVDNTEWKQFNAIVTAPATATKLYFEVRAYKGEDGTAGGSIYLDDIEIFEQN